MVAVMENALGFMSSPAISPYRYCSEIDNIVPIPFINECWQAPMEWNDLRIFLAIAREGTLGAAARKLGQSQPTMGRRLRALEQSVGQILFQRTGEGFVLTDEGTAILAHAERMEEEALAVQRQLAGKDGQLQECCASPPPTGSARICWHPYSPNSPSRNRASRSSCSPMPGSTAFRGGKPTWCSASSALTSPK
jgi:molybdenum-dependent DNA-binding transcriptional regulator ModE